MTRLRSGPSSNELEEEFASAWRRYLRTVRAAPRDEYESVEEAAWRRLCHELAKLGVTGYQPR